MADDRWELWRQDDNGNRVFMALFFNRDAAEYERKRYEERGHKQFYWIQPEAKKKKR